MLARKWQAIEKGHGEKISNTNFIDILKSLEKSIVANIEGLNNKSLAK